jgi:CAAX prenyl protease-like protein
MHSRPGISGSLSAATQSIAQALTQAACGNASIEARRSNGREAVGEPVKGIEQTSKLPRPGRREGHGWGAYFLPYLAFMLVISIGDKLPSDLRAYLLPLRVIAPLAFLIFYYRRGHYPELRAYPFGLRGFALDFAVGIAGAALWMAPYLWIDSLRPDEPGFDPNLWGASLLPLALLVRAAGYGIVTPFMEELFVRSWLLRFADVCDKRDDFRDVPIGRFTWRSFTVVVIWFTLSHVAWERPVAIPWVVLTMLWFYHRKNLMSLVIAHAGSNLGILAFVILQSGRWLDANGNPISLWFFV